MPKGGVQTLREVEYEDPQGRKWARILPSDASDSDAIVGVPVGPPSLDSLELPLEVAVRLHNQLFHRRIFTRQDAEKRTQDIAGALMSALKVDVQRILSVYAEFGTEDRTRR